MDGSRAVVRVIASGTGVDLWSRQRSDKQAAADGLAALQARPIASVRACGVPRPRAAASPSASAVPEGESALPR